MTTEAILDDREKQYGSFKNTGHAFERIYRAILPMSKALTNTPLLYAYAGISMKLARLCNNPLHIDSWRDIAGYATLAADYLEGRDHE